MVRFHNIGFLKIKGNQEIYEWISLMNLLVTFNL